MSLRNFWQRFLGIALLCAGCSTEGPLRLPEGIPCGPGNGNENVTAGVKEVTIKRGVTLLQLNHARNSARTFIPFPFIHDGGIEFTSQVETDDGIQSANIESGVWYTLRPGGDVTHRFIALDLPFDGSDMARVIWGDETVDHRDPVDAICTDGQGNYYRRQMTK